MKQLISIILFLFLNIGLLNAQTYNSSQRRSSPYLKSNSTRSNSSGYYYQSQNNSRTYNSTQTTNRNTNQSSVNTNRSTQSNSGYKNKKQRRSQRLNNLLQEVLTIPLQRTESSNSGGGWTTPVGLSTPVEMSTPIKDWSKKAELSTPIKNWSKTVELSTEVKDWTKPVEMSTPVQNYTKEVELSTEVKDWTEKTENWSTPIEDWTTPVEMSTPVKNYTREIELSTPVDLSKEVELSSPIQNYTRKIELSTPVNLSTPVDLSREIELSTPVEFSNEVELSNPYELSTPVDLSSEVELSNQVELSTPVDISNEVELSNPVELSNKVELSNPYELSSPVDISNEVKLSKPNQLSDPVNISNNVNLSEQTELSKKVEINNHTFENTTTQISNNYTKASTHVSNATKVNSINSPSINLMTGIIKAKGTNSNETEDYNKFVSENWDVIDKNLEGIADVASFFADGTWVGTGYAMDANNWYLNHYIQSVVNNDENYWDLVGLGLTSLWTPDNYQKTLTAFTLGAFVPASKATKIIVGTAAKTEGKLISNVATTSNNGKLVAKGISETPKSVWTQNQIDRGYAVEKILGGNLPPGYPVVDKFVNGTATSIKSIDVTAKSYQNTSKFSSVLKGYVDKVSKFNGEKYSTKIIRKGEIKSRGLDIGIQKGKTSQDQFKILQQIKKYGQEKGVDVNIYYIN